MTYFTIRTFFDGMLCMMLLYTCITYFWQRKNTLVYYAIYLVSILAYLKINDLYDHAVDVHAPQNIKDIHDFAFGTIECISFNLYGRFAIEFMELRKHDPLTVKIINAILFISSASVVFLASYLFLGIISDDFYQYYKFINRYILVALTIVAIFRIVKLRNRVVYFFVLGSLFYVLGMLASVALSQTKLGSRTIGVLWTYPMLWTELGMILETIFFTIGFTVLNRRTELEKLRFQEQLVEQLLENERKQQKLQLIRDDIARDLHDEVGSDLSALSIMSEVGIKQADRSAQEAKSTFITIGKLSRNVLSTMREIVWSLDSTQDSVASMFVRMEEMANTMFAFTLIQFQLNLPKIKSTQIIQPHNRRDFLLIYKEILHNIIKHSKASKAVISLNLTERNITLIVEDNGIGFEMNDQNNIGNGLKNIRQRSEKLTGSLSIESDISIGTVIKVNCPIQQVD